MAEDLARALAWCLEALEKRRLTIEDCLERYPEHRAELQELLPLAITVSHAPEVQPSLEFRLDARQRLIGQLKPRPLGAGTFLRHLVSTGRKKPKQRPLRRRALSWTAIAALVLSLFAVSGVGVAYAADGSAPGDALYGLDTAIEAARLDLTFDQEGKAELALQFAQERLAEIQELAAEGSSGENFEKAADGYGEMIRTAAEALAAVAASDDLERAAALGALLQTSLSVHGEVLEGVKERVPEAARSPVDRAQIASEQGRATVEALLADEIPGNQTDGVPGIAPDLTPAASPDDAPGLGPISTPLQPMDDSATGFPNGTPPGPLDLTPELIPSDLPAGGGQP